MSKKSASDKIGVSMVEGTIDEKGKYTPEKGLKEKKGKVRNLSAAQIEEAKRTGKYKEWEEEVR